MSTRTPHRLPAHRHDRSGCRPRHGRRGHRADCPAHWLRPTRPTALPAGVDRATLLRWAEDTWRSLVAMTPDATGLPADNITGDLASTRSGYTSPTNIGGYMWSAVVARELGIITPKECTRRVRQTLADAARHGAPRAERHVLQLVRRGHRCSCSAAGPAPEPGVSLRLQRRQRLARAPRSGSSATPCPEASDLARRLFGRMRWDAFYDPNASRPGGLLHGGFFTQKYGHDRPGRTPVYLGTHIGGEDGLVDRPTTTTRSSPRPGSPPTSAS